MNCFLKCFVPIVLIAAPAFCHHYACIMKIETVPANNDLAGSDNEKPIAPAIFLHFHATHLYADDNRKLFSIGDADIHQNGFFQAQGKQYSTKDLHDTISASIDSPQSTKILMWMEAGEECDAKIWNKILKFSSQIISKDRIHVYYEAFALEKEAQVHGLPLVYYHELDYQISFAELGDEMLNGRSIIPVNSSKDNGMLECQLMKVSLIGHPNASTLLDDLINKDASTWMVFVPKQRSIDEWLRLSIKFAILRTKAFVNFEYIVRTTVVLVKFTWGNETVILDAALNEKPRLLHFRGFKNEIQDKKGKIIKQKVEPKKTDVQEKISKMLDVLKKFKANIKVFVAFNPGRLPTETTEINADAWILVSTDAPTERTNKFPMSDNENFTAVTDIVLPYKNEGTVGGHLP